MALTKVPHGLSAHTSIETLQSELDALIESLPE